MNHAHVDEAYSCDLLSHGDGERAGQNMVEGDARSGSSIDWRRYQDHRVRLAGWNANLPLDVRLTLRGPNKFAW